MFNSHSLYQNGKMRAHIERFKLFYDKGGCGTYGDFQKLIPILTEKGLSKKIAQLIEKNNLQSCSFSMTSGTTGKPKLLVNSLWRNGNRVNYATYFKRMMEKYVLSKIDVVANLFTAGGFSTLYDGCNRLLEGIGCHLLPIGRLDSFPKAAQHQMLLKMQQVGLNTLFGTPSSIIYLLKLSQSCGINLNIKKLIFTGEPFSSEKRAYVKTIWRSASIYGLYGHSETGFIGFNTDQCLSQHYHYFDDWFFLETVQENELLVTSYADTLMPIIRYQVGDQAELLGSQCRCGINLPILSLRGRKDEKFNFAGNLISSEAIKNKLAKFSQRVIEFQIQLQSVQEGQDQLGLIVNAEHMDKTKKDGLHNAILEIDEIYEAIQKKAGYLTIQLSKRFLSTERQKQPLIVDFRFKESK